MTDPDSLSYVVGLLFREYPGTLLLWAAFAIFLPVLTLRTATTRSSAASLVLMLSLPIPIASYVILSGFKRELDHNWWHMMKIPGLAELGAMFCSLLLLGILSLLPGLVVALSLLLRRALATAEQRT